MIIKGLEKHRELYYSGIKEEDVIWLTALTSKNFSELYKIISQVLPEEKLKRFMEGAVGMSKDEFVLHEWNKELFDDLVKYNEIEDAKKEGKSLGIEEGKSLGIEEGRALGKAEGTKEKAIEIARKMLNMKMSIEDISKATGLTIAEIQKL